MFGTYKVLYYYILTTIQLTISIFLNNLVIFNLRRSVMVSFIILYFYMLDLNNTQIKFFFNGRLVCGFNTHRNPCSCI